MNRELTLVGAAGLGAGLMYFLDPVLGRRRRVTARDKAGRLIARADDLINKTGRDIAQRSAGLVAEASACLGGKLMVPDDVLVERVRAKMGRVCSHLSALQISARQGRVILSGPILADDVRPVLRAVASVRGVCEVEDRMAIHEEAGNISALQ